MAAISADAGMVKTQAQTMFPATQLLLEESERRGFTYGTVEDPPGD